MRERELADELARRTGLSPDDVAAVLSALAVVGREQEAPGEQLPLSRAGAPPDAAGHPSSGSFRPSPGDVDDLIAAAGRHPLGLDFLLHGDLCAVAIMFQAHAFTVDAARERLRKDVGVAGA